jgi:two-component system NtrC family sensor kinase
LTEGILRDGNVLPLLRVVEDLQVLSQTVVEEEAIARALENQAQRYQGLIVTTSVLISTLLALGISLLIARSLLRPLRQVTEMAHQVQQKSDFDLRVSVNSKDEVGEPWRTPLMP